MVAPFVPRPLLPGGIVTPLYREPADAAAALLNEQRVHGPETYNLGDYRGPDERIATVTNVHSPSFDMYGARGGEDTGACVILVPGGGNRVLGVGSCCDLVPTFSAFGVATAILRCRLRSDGYNMARDALHDTLRCVQLVRDNAESWGLDPQRIGIVGFSAGATHSASAATEYVAYDARQVAGATTSRPDFVGLLFPGPTLFETTASKALTELGFGRFAGMTAAGAESQAELEAQRELEIAQRDGMPLIPSDVPPSWVASPGPGDRIHAAWALEYYAAMLFEGVPNIELMLYARGVHGKLPLGGGADGVSAWHARFLEWMRALGFLREKGLETVAARDVAAFVARQPVAQVVGPGAMRARM